MKNTVTIRGKEYRVKNTIRAMMLFERYAGECRQPQSLTERLAYLWCILLACQPKDEAPIDFDDFVDAIDENPEIMTEMNGILQSSGNHDGSFMRGEGKDQKKK